MSRPSSSRRNGSVVISSMYTQGREVLDVAGDRNRRGELEIGGQADGSVPAVGEWADLDCHDFHDDPLSPKAINSGSGMSFLDRAKWPAREPQVISEAGIRKGAVREPITTSLPRGRFCAGIHQAVGDDRKSFVIRSGCRSRGFCVTREGLQCFLIASKR